MSYEPLRQSSLPKEGVSYHEIELPIGASDDPALSTRTPPSTSPPEDGELISTQSLLSCPSSAQVQRISVRKRHSALHKKTPNVDCVELREFERSHSPYPFELSGQQTRCDGNFARSETGWWKSQMLVDRSLRSMAALTSFFALIMLIVVFVYMPEFIRRRNRHSTSVYQSIENCISAGNRVTAYHLLINIAATMVLGMSNTYQQLITALDVQDIPNMLRNHGDCKVGTNSPFSIYYKTTGKLSSWLAWLLLIGTSLPIHFLANSVVGTSYYMGPPAQIRFNATTASKNISRIYSSDVVCWSAFRTGQYYWPRNYSLEQLDDTDANSRIISILKDSYGTVTNSNMVIDYMDSFCSPYRETASLSEVQKELQSDLMRVGSCTSGQNMRCQYQNPKGRNLKAYPACRVSIRMQAALTLAGALVVKAGYMITIILLARHKNKTQCLTFGDVVAASAMDYKMQVLNECMVNSADACRKEVKHSCHNHCDEKVPSSTGDEIGHCQRCKQYNKVNRSASLEHPVMATKYKRSFISNLGFTAVVQMILLMFCLVCMLGVSLSIVVSLRNTWTSYEKQCQDGQMLEDWDMGKEECLENRKTAWRHASGTWGGFRSVALLLALKPNQIRSETTAFAISNGAQLVYSLLYLLLVFNLTLISMEREWGSFERTRRRLRCTIFKGEGFRQSYLLQLPKLVLFPLMALSAMMHWLLGQAIGATELVRNIPGNSTIGIDSFEASQYLVTYGSYPVWISAILMLIINSTCWWAFLFSREGYAPQMYGSIRVCCASSTNLKDYPLEGIQWGDLGKGERFRHAGFSSSSVGKIVPGELYCGTGNSSVQTEDRTELDTN